MTDIKQLAKDFESLNGYPLKSDPRTKSFTTNDKKKLQFLESVKEFCLSILLLIIIFCIPGLFNHSTISLIYIFSPRDKL